jgi:hypothetical protein
MASTYSPSLRIQLIETGTENEAWGQPLDNNLGTIIEQAITGVNSISLTNLTSYTLTAANASPDQARNAVLVFTGALSANCNVIAPAVKKVYIVSNQTTGGKNISITVGSGSNVAVANGTNQLVYCNGTSFKSAVDVNSITGNLTVSGNSSVGGNVTVSGGIVFGSGNITTTNGNLTLRSTTSNVVNFQGSTGALTLPTGTTAQRPGTPVVGMSRWNTDLGWYEIWNGLIWQQITGSFAVSYLFVAGGAGGGVCNSFGFRGGGGGGAGGVLVGSVTVQPGTAYTITVGAGGAAAVNGSNTTALGFTAVRGGFGGGQASVAASGGSGGGSQGSTSSAPGSGTAGQGNDGGYALSSDQCGGGGGGAAAIGANATSTTGGSGGAGTSSSISGSLVYYAGGGGAGISNVNGSGLTAGSGGIGGGGQGGTPGTQNTPGDGAVKATNGTANTGGGGGGDTALVYSGGAQQTSLGAGSGGSGIAILSYANPTQTATGGTVTSYSAGGNTYWVHTFTTSGTFTTS